MNQKINPQYLTDQLNLLDKIDIDYELKVKVYNSLWHKWIADLNTNTFKKHGTYTGKVCFDYPSLPNKNDWGGMLDGWKRGLFIVLRKHE